MDRISRCVCISLEQCLRVNKLISDFLLCREDLTLNIRKCIHSPGALLNLKGALKEKWKTSIYQPSASVSHKVRSIKLKNLEYPVNQNINRRQSRGILEFFFGQSRGQEDREKRHQSPFQSFQSSSASQGEPYAFSL